MAVQPWGRDGDKRRHWLIEGLDDTYFRVYRESTRFKGKNKVLSTWWSVADGIENVKLLGDKLRGDNSLPARKLADGITAAIPRFEAGEEVPTFQVYLAMTDFIYQKRKRREYRQARKAQFKRPDPGMSLYEGRTRGKRGKYTFSDDDDFDSDEPSTKRQRTSGISTPAEHHGPVVTASGRQVKARGGGIYGESLLVGQRPAQSSIVDDVDGGEDEASKVRTRSGRASGTSRAGRSYVKSYNDVDDMDEESDAPSAEWDSDKNDDDVDDNLADEEDDDEDEQMSDVLDEDDGEICKQSKLITLKISKTNAAKLSKIEALQVEKKPLRDTISPLESIVLERSVMANQHKLQNGDSKIGVQTPLQQDHKQDLKQHNIQSTSDSNALPPHNLPWTASFEPSQQSTKPDVAELEEVKTIQAPTPPLSDNLQNGHRAGSGLPSEDFIIRGFPAPKAEVL